MTSSISIVVPTRDRPAALARCAAALARDGAGDLDVVVVDDGSRDRAALAAALQPLPRARLVQGAGRGPAAARNLGWRAAEGEIVCFIDDDCEPSRGWARRLAEAALAIGASAGRTRSEAGASAAAEAAQTITNWLMLASLDPATGLLGFAPSCNLAVARERLADLPFDERYPFAAGEDRDWCERARAAGLGIIYEEAADVAHRPSLDPRSFLRQQYRYGRGAARFRAGEPARRLAPLSFYTGLVGSGFAAGPAVGAAVLTAQAATATGVLAERWARLRLRAVARGAARRRARPSRRR